ncbi:MAG: DUF4010 domain-containing protein [Candidatus Nanohaloarchaea archaeon]|nr:DUF4010 domain-containing protein [Candidatus Nanohaloarchaea archaeon]
METVVLQQVVLAFALGALVGLERERAPGHKHAGLRTLSLITGAGPLSVVASRLSGSAAPLAAYLLVAATFSFLVVYIRAKEHESLGLTTSSSVFVMALVGVLVGYHRYFAAVSITLIAVFLLSEKEEFRRYMEMLEPEEISDAVALGILALVLYPVLPPGAVDPYGVLFLRKALLFVIFILLIQFAAYVALEWVENRIGFLLSTGLGGVVSSLAVVTTMAHLSSDRDLEGAAYAGAVLAPAAMVARNGFIAGVLAPSTVPELVVPLSLSTVLGAGFAVYYYQGWKKEEVPSFGRHSPFSFREAFRFGVLFLGILMVSEIAKTQFSLLGVYGTAFLGGFASSTAVVASAATLLTAGAVNPFQASAMVVLGIVASLSSKVIYVEWGGARELTRKIILPYGLMTLAVLSVFLI